MGGGSSSSASTSQTTTAQTTSGSGSESPSVSAGGSVTINSAGGEVSLAALQGMAQVIQEALSQAGSVNTQSLDLLSNFNEAEAAAQVQQQTNDQSLLQSILGNNQTLAENVQSGGATTGMDLTTKVVIGALILMGVLVVAMLFRK